MSISRGIKTKTTFDGPTLACLHFSLAIFLFLFLPIGIVVVVVVAVFVIDAIAVILRFADCTVAVTSHRLCNDGPHWIVLAHRIGLSDYITPKSILSTDFRSRDHCRWNWDTGGGEDGEDERKDGFCCCWQSSAGRSKVKDWNRIVDQTVDNSKKNDWIQSYHWSISHLPTKKKKKKKMRINKNPKKCVK